MALLSGFTNRELEDILHGGIICTNKQKDNYCPECGASDFIEDYAKGMIYCSCGQVLDSIFDNGVERRNHDGDDGDNAKNGMVHNRLLPQSSLGTTVTAKGRLKKLHIWNAMPYKERSDNIMFKRIREVCTANSINKKIELDAQILCKRVSGTVHKLGSNKGKPIITRGFNRSGIVAGCLFIACRRGDETRAVKEISYYFDISERDVNKGIRSLLDILDDDNIVKDIGTSKVIHFIQRKCDELHIKNQYTSIAKTIANNIDKLNIASNHTTYSLAAASILLMAVMNGLKSITKKRLSTTFCGLSDVTIGKTYNQIKELKMILTNDSKVDDIIKEITRQRNKRIITEDVYNQMRRFKVDTSKYILEGQEYDTNMLNTREPTRYELLTEQNDNYGSISADDSQEDLKSGDSYDDFAFMMADVRNTIKELKYMNILNENSMDIVQNIHEKMNIIKLYMDQWAIESGIYPYNK
jgi:transcription initiation factor TFIIB